MERVSLIELKMEKAEIDASYLNKFIWSYITYGFFQSHLQPDASDVRNDTKSNF